MSAPNGPKYIAVSVWLHQAATGPKLTALPCKVRLQSTAKWPRQHFEVLRTCCHPSTKQVAMQTDCRSTMVLRVRHVEARRGTLTHTDRHRGCTLKAKTRNRHHDQEGDRKSRGSPRGGIALQDTITENTEENNGTQKGRRRGTRGGVAYGARRDTETHRDAQRDTDGHRAAQRRTQ